MRSSTFSKPLHRVVAAIVALALGLSLVGVGMAPSALAAAQATIGSNGQGSNLNTSEGTIWGGLFNVTIDGNASVAFCIDLETGLNKSYSYWEVDFASAITDPADRTRILKILHYYGPSGTTYPGSATPVGPAGKQITGTGDEKAASVQAAIWHFSDGMTLYSEGSTSTTEKANYDTILANVDGLADPGNPGVSLDIAEPASTTAEAGQVVGPYTISTTAPSVALATAPGVTITDAAGNALPGPYGNGTQLWLKKATAGDHAVAVTAEATAQVVAGRAFVAKDHTGKVLKSQKLILAHSVQSKVKDTAKAKWTEPVLHKAKVRKQINGGPIPANGFEFTLTGGDLGAPITGTVSQDDGYAWMGQNLKPGTYTMTETPLAGWQQRATGCDAPAANVQVQGASVTFDIPVAQQSTKVQCHFENNKLYDISIKKVVTTDDGTWEDAGYDPATETFTVAYSCTKPNLPAITGQVVLKHNETKTVSDIPYGYSCGITGEPALPTLVDGVAWNAPGLPDAVVVNGTGKKLTVTNSFADRRVAFTVTKQLVNLAGSGVGDDDEFPVSVDCTKDGSPTLEYDFWLAHEDSWTSPKLPTGYSCAIAEGTLPALSDGFGWDAPAISPNPVVTGQHNSATITNKVLDQRVRFSVKKVLVNKDDSGITDTTDFDIDVSCSKDGAPDKEFSFSLHHDETWTSPLIPAGYTCEAEEELLPGLADGFAWDDVVVSPSSLATGQGELITVTNTVLDPRVVLTVDKDFANLAGSGVGDDQEFAIDVECTKDGFPTKSFDLSLADGESWTSPKLPAGYQCVVTETIPAELEQLLNDGFSFADPVFTPANGTVTTADQDLTVSVDNQVDDDRVFISLAKQLEGDLEDADVAAGTEYVVDVVCTDDDSADTLTFDDVEVKAGETTTGIGPIPIGWSCTADEDESSLPTLAPGHIWLPESVVGTTVGEQGGTVTVTNTVEDKRSAITIRKDVVEGSATSGTFTFDFLKIDGETTEVIAEDVEVEVGADPVVLADELTAGTYQVVEDAASGWDLVGVECSVEGGGDTVTLGDTDGAKVACAATNVELGSITVVKETAPADADVDFPVTLTGDGYEEDATVNATADPVVFDGLLPGTYALTEGEVDGWDNGPIECTVAGEDVELSAAAVLEDGIAVTPGDDVTCTITNVERGSITVTKQVEGDTVTTDETVTAWVEDVEISLECDDEQALTLTLEPGAEPGTLVSSDVLDVAAGTTCVVTEVSDGVTAAGAVDITIDGVAIVEGTPSSPITVDAGEELVVSVVNTYEGTEVEGEVITKKPTQVAGEQLPRTGSPLTQQLTLVAGVLITLGGLVLALGALTPRRREV